MNLERASAYHGRHAPHALLVVDGDEIVHETYAGGYDAGKPHALYSGTKSFWGVAAAAAETDRLLSLDERVAETIPEWNGDAWKQRVTLRDLLQLSSGIGFGGLGNAVPTYDRALAVNLKNEPGTTFTYGGIPLQVFGAVLARKLLPRGKTPHDYLRERVLDRAGVVVDRWRALADGSNPLPTGAFMTARHWAAYGRFICRGGAGVIDETAVAKCLRPSRVNPRYGLGFWLAQTNGGREIAYASGSGGQACYVARSLGITIVRFGASSSWRHEAFLRALFG